MAVKIARQQKKIALIGAPSSAAAFLPGSEKAPAALRAAGLVEVAERHGVKATLIDSAMDIDPKWLEGVKSVGLTAGASAPEVLVEQVSQRLAEHGFTDQRDLDLIREDVRFTLPPELATIAPAPRR